MSGDKCGTVCHGPASLTDEICVEVSADSLGWLRSAPEGKPLCDCAGDSLIESALYPPCLSLDVSGVNSYSCAEGDNVYYTAEVRPKVIVCVSWTVSCCEGVESLSIKGASRLMLLRLIVGL